MSAIDIIASQTSPAGPSSISFEKPAALAPVGRTDQPAVIVSLSNGVTSTQATTTLRSLNPDKVDDALSWASGANGFAQNAADFDYNAALSHFGKAIADRDRADVNGGAASSATYALAYASSLGIPVQDSVSPEAVKNGAAPGTISVGAFSFTNAGSTYTVTSGKGGTLVGTKDGQAWKTWQLSQTESTTADAAATAALKTLTALNTSNVTAKKSLPLDLSA